jgi:hypothetical protein
MRKGLVVAAAVFALIYITVPQVRSEEVTCEGIDQAELQKMIDHGLEYIKSQQKPDGHWDAQGQYPLTMTGLCGMALLMEGSTIREGKYSEQIRKAVDFLLTPGRPQPSGLLCNMNTPGEAGRYMYGHGYAMMFLACVYGEEEDEARRKRLEEVLVKAAKYSRDAQTSAGGYGYVSAKDGGNFDEGSCTVPQVQATRACRNAGISLDPNLIKDAMKYLHDCTQPPDNGGEIRPGGVIYSLRQGGGGVGSPALTSAAICCGFSSGHYEDRDVKRWIKFVQSQPGLMQGGGGRFGHDEYTHYYFGQCVYFLGDDGYEKFFPNSKESERVTWSNYKKITFKNLLSSQNKGDGSWSGAQVGPIYCTACYMALLQMDKAVLPLYQR